VPEQVVVCFGKYILIQRYVGNWEYVLKFVFIFISIFSLLIKLETIIFMHVGSICYIYSSILTIFSHPFVYSSKSRETYKCFPCLGSIYSEILATILGTTLRWDSPKTM